MARRKVSEMNEQEKAEYMREKLDGMKTQGVKGATLKKLNLPLTPANEVFVRVVAKAGGLSQGKLINMAIDEYRAAHPDLMNKANAFLEELTGESAGSLPEDDGQEGN